MKVSLVFIGNEGPRLVLESQTYADILALSMIVELHGFEVADCKEKGFPVSVGDWSRPFAGNHKHLEVGLIPTYDPEKS